MKTVNNFINRENLYFFLEEESLHRNIPLSARFNNKMPPVCTTAFASTDEDYSSLMGVLRSENILLTGNPRRDFLNQPTQTHQLQKDILLKKYSDFVVFNSNFSFVFPPRDHTTKNLEKDGAWKSLEERDKLLDYLQRHKKRALEVCEILKSLANDQTVIYRPHPLESVALVRQHFAGSNIIIDSSFSILPWIMAARQVLHSGCTTAIESSLYGKKPIFLKPLDDEKDQRPFKLSESIDSLNELKTLINTKIPRLSDEEVEKNWQSSVGSKTSNLAGNSAKMIAREIHSKMSHASFATLFLIRTALFFINPWFSRKIKRSPKESARITSDRFEIISTWRFHSNDQRIKTINPYCFEISN